MIVIEDVTCFLNSAEPTHFLRRSGAAQFKERIQHKESVLAISGDQLLPMHSADIGFCSALLEFCRERSFFAFIMLLESGQLADYGLGHDFHDMRPFGNGDETDPQPLEQIDFVRKGMAIKVPGLEDSDEYIVGKLLPESRLLNRLKIQGLFQFDGNAFLTLFHVEVDVLHLTVAGITVAFKIFFYRFEQVFFHELILIEAGDIFNDSGAHELTCRAICDIIKQLLYNM